MMMKLLLFLAFLLCISAVHGLKCYQCVSTSSWDDCKDVRKKQTCSSGEERCAKAYAEVEGEGVKGKGFAKGCATEAECEASEDSSLCKNDTPGVKVKCELSCCSGDFCNSATLPAVSVFVILPCALAAFFR